MLSRWTKKHARLARASNYPSSSSEHHLHLRPGSSAGLEVSGSGLPAQVWVWWRYLPWAGLAAGPGCRGCQRQEELGQPCIPCSWHHSCTEQPREGTGKISTAQSLSCSSPDLSRCPLGCQRALEQQCWAARAPGTCPAAVQEPQVGGREGPTRPLSMEHPLGPGRAQLFWCQLGAPASISPSPANASMAVGLAGMMLIPFPWRAR